MKKFHCILGLITGYGVYSVGMWLPPSLLGLTAVVIGGSMAITSVVVFMDKTID